MKTDIELLEGVTEAIMAGDTETSDTLLRQVITNKAQAYVQRTLNEKVVPSEELKKSKEEKDKEQKEAARLTLEDADKQQ